MNTKKSERLYNKKRDNLFQVSINPKNKQMVTTRRETNKK